MRRGEERGTVLYYHKDDSKKAAHERTPRVSVLPDNRRRSEGAVLWECQEIERIGILTTTCPVCGQHHLVYYCPLRI